MGRRKKVEGSARDRRNGQSIPAEGAPRFFARIAEEFLEHKRKKFKAETWRNFSRLVPNLTRYFGESTTIESISEQHVQRFVLKRARHLAASSVALELAILKQIFAFAIELGLLKQNPARTIKRPALQEIEHRFLSREEFSRVLEACPAWLQPIVELSIATGLRRGEIVNLRWDDVEEQKGTLRIRPPSGSRASTARIIPLNEMARHAIAAARPDRVDRSAPVFLGTSVTTDNLSEAFMRACRSVGVKGVSFRHLRHTAANWMADQGVDIQTISIFLGTKNLESAARYLRKSDSRLNDAIAAINRSVLPARLDHNERKRAKSGCTSPKRTDSHDRNKQNGKPRKLLKTNV